MPALSPFQTSGGSFAPLNTRSNKNNLKFGKFHDDICVTTDFLDGTSTFEAERRMRDVGRFIQQNSQQLAMTGWLSQEAASKIPGKTLPSVQFISDISNIPYESLSLQRLGGSRINNDVFVHVTDPGVGVKATHDRSILVTQNHGVYVGPNNGSLSLLAATLKTTGEPHKLLPIDFNKVKEFESLRLNNPGYELPHTFHARDVFAVVASAIANGVEPEKFEDTQLAPKVSIVDTPFASTCTPLPLQVGQQAQLVGLRDKTAGNVKTNLMVSLPQRTALAKADALYAVTWQDKGQTNTLAVPFKEFFSQVPKGQPLAYSGSSYSPLPGNFFVELALNGGSFSDVIQLPHGENKPLLIERIR